MAKITVKKLTGLIADYNGNLSMVAKKLNVSRNTVYRFIEKNPTCKESLEEAREKMIDNVESAFYNRALSGDTTAMIFFLKTQGKSRGYVERQEVTGADGNTITVRLMDDGNGS